MAADFPNFEILDDEMLARRLYGQIRFDDVDLDRYFEMAGLSERLELGLPGECLICFERKLVKNRPCCDLAVCRDCLKSYYASLVSNAIVKIQCIGYSCDEYVAPDELFLHLDDHLRQRFRQFLVDANKNPNQKTCPRCNHITDLDPKAQNTTGDAKKFGVPVTCPECELVWCFRCQGPWHEMLSCKEYQRGDALFKSWTRQRQHEQLNAQKCPKCKVFIQRSSGCDHMTCNRCSTNFCYQCGEKYRSLKLIGNHQSRLSIFGCKYRFKPDDPTKRRLIRGSIFCGKLLAAPVIGGLALGAGAVVLGIGLVALPFYGGYQLHKLVRRRRREKLEKMDREMWSVAESRPRLRETFVVDELERARRVKRLSAPEIFPAGFDDSVPDTTLSAIAEESNIDIEGFNWELNSYEYYCCHEDPEFYDSDSKQDDDDDSECRPDVFCSRRDRDVGRSYPESSSFEIDDDCISVCALNSSCDSSDSCASLGFGDPDVPGVVFVMKCSHTEGKRKAPSCVEERGKKVPSCVEERGEKVPSRTEVAGPESDEDVPKGDKCGLPVLVRKNGVRHRPNRRESDRATDNESTAVEEKLLEESRQSGLTDKSERKPGKGEYINPCDMLTHL